VTDLGWNASFVVHDAQLGLGVFAMLIVPVLLVHVAAQFVIPSKESHPFIDLIMADPRFEYLLPIGFAALIAAPFVEEYFFRVLLQGWLERVTARLEAGKGAEASALNCSAPESDGPPHDELPSHEWLPEDMEADEVPVQIASGQAPEAPALPRSTGLRWFTILISSVAFASAHVGQGPAPISLFLLALGLGYVYQRTHRVFPCILVHFLVNLTAVIQLAVAVASHAR
jgi:membrane protease YdiL (CAAX protease family)